MHLVFFKRGNYLFRWCGNSSIALLLKGGIFETVVELLKCSLIILSIIKTANEIVDELTIIIYI